MVADEQPTDAGRRLARMGSVRMRTALAAVVVVGTALILTSFALIGVLRATLTDEVRSEVELRAGELAAAIAAGGGSIPPLVTDADMLIQILDERGRVVASTPNVRGEPALAHPGAGGTFVVNVAGATSDYLAAAHPAATDSGRITVVVARTLEDVTEAARTIIILLLIGLPILLLVVAATARRVVGRALAPVDAIRREVDEISENQLHRRVPDARGASEIARLARTMNGMLDRLERAQARQRGFVSDASHELRSPVASIRHNAEVAQAHPDRTTVPELAEAVLAENLRLERLVDDLLLLARADEHALPRRRPVDLDDLVFDEAHRLRDTTDLRVDTTGVSGGRVDGDALGLGRALRNLGDNAARHARNSVTFALAERGTIVVLSVEDDGPGIPDAHRERVFERFVRLDDARGRDDGGSGLGLAIVAQVIRAHGGSASIGSGPLGGARVEVTLPSASGPRD